MAPAVSIDPALPTLKWFHVIIRVHGNTIAVRVIVDEKETEIFRQSLLEPKIIVADVPGSPQKLNIEPCYPFGSAGFRADKNERAEYRNIRVRRI